MELAPDYLEKSDAASRCAGSLRASCSLQRSDQIDGTFDAICRGGTAWRVGAGRQDGPLFSERQPIASAPWTAALFRAEIFQRVGLLEERFESYLEDVDFGLRCAAQGIAGVYEPAAVAWHQGSATLGRWHPETVRRIARNQVFLLARHYPASLLARWMWPILAAHLLWGGVALRHGAGIAWLRGVAQGLRRFLRECEKPASESTKKHWVVLLQSQERVIRQVQASTGYDAYWRWYFWLAGGA